MLWLLFVIYYRSGVVRQYIVFVCSVAVLRRCYWFLMQISFGLSFNIISILMILYISILDVVDHTLLDFGLMATTVEFHTRIKDV